MIALPSSGAYWHIEQETLDNSKCLDQTATFNGNKGYSWKQLAALPTDPAKLWPIVEAAGQLSACTPGIPAAVAASKADRDLFQSTWTLLTSDPVPTALAEALYEDAAKIPGVVLIRSVGGACFAVRARVVPGQCGRGATT